MGSPEDSAKTNRIASASPPSQDSNFSNYLSNLSPLEAIKVAKVAQAFPELRIPSPVFKSPHTNLPRETSFLKRSQYHFLSGAELIQCDAHKVATCSDVSGPSFTKSISEIIPGTEEVSKLVQPRCPASVDKYLADQLEVDLSNSAGATDSCLKESDVVPRELKYVCGSSKETIKNIDNNDGISKIMEDEVVKSTSSLDKDADSLLGKPWLSVRPAEIQGERRNDERPLIKHLNLKSEIFNDLIGCNSCHGQVLGATYNEHLVGKLTTDSKSQGKDNANVDYHEKRVPCSTNLCHHSSKGILPNAEGCQQEQWDCTPQLLRESLHIVLACKSDDKTGFILNESSENGRPDDHEEANQNQRGMRRRLRFEAGENAISNGSNSLNPTNIVTNLKLPANRTGLELLDSSNVEPSATSTDSRPANLSQCITSVMSLSGAKTIETCVIDILDGNNKVSPIPGPTPSGIGLHLNSIVSAVSMGSSATSGMKSAENLSAEREKSVSVKSGHLCEDSGSGSLATSLVDKLSFSNDDHQQEGWERGVASHATFQSPHRTNSMQVSNQLNLVDHCMTLFDKGKSSSENANGSEELKLLSPKKKRKRVQYSIENVNCKRCNCKKSKCLKLYCDCFAAGVYCAESCACQDCFNKLDYEDTVLGTRQQIESRNALAFAPKIVPQSSGEDINRMTPSSARHKRGCNCKKSMCLKKYCECYQANVGCSEGCRCEGCKNIYGAKEGYGGITEMAYKRVGDETCNDLSDKKLDMDSGRNYSNTKQLHQHNLTPLTSSFQSSNHGKNMRQLQLSAGRYITSPESDINILSSHGESRTSPRNSNSHCGQVDITKDVLDIASCDQDLDVSNAGMANQYVPTWDRITDTCHITPLQHHPLRAMASPASSITRDITKKSWVQGYNMGETMSSIGSVGWQCSSLTPTPQLSGSIFMQEPESTSQLYRIMEDDRPDILKDASTCTKGVKVSSPNKKRVSLPHGPLHALRSSSSQGLKSGHKFILQAVSSLPPRTPYNDPKGGSNPYVDNPGSSCGDK